MPHRAVMKLALLTALSACQVSDGVAQSPAIFRFRDVAAEAGLLPAAKGIHAHGAAWGDVDNDGWPDLYLGTFHYQDSQPNLLLYNRRGTFQLGPQKTVRISTRATGVLLVDLDNDGDLDLYVASMPAPVGSRLAGRLGHPLAGCSLFRNDKGRFVNVSEANAACPVKFGGRSAAAADYDGDGLLDLLVGEDPLPGYNGSPTKSTRLFRNLGGFRFEDVSRKAGIPEDAAGLGVAAADLNQDGWPDLLVCSTLGNHVLLNDGRGRFTAPDHLRETLSWPEAGGDDMVCGVAVGDVNQDGWPDVFIGQHFGAPWRSPVANRLYLSGGAGDGKLRFADVTQSAGLPPLPLKAPHVEIQDFDNDGLPDLYASLVLFDGETPHPLIFRNLGSSEAGVRFQQKALDANDFPTADDRAAKRSSVFFDKMVRERKVMYAAPGPTCDFDRDGRLDMFLGSWWKESPSLLLRNETPSGYWLDVQLECHSESGVNRMGIGARVSVFSAGQSGKPARLGSREIATGFGYASSQEAAAHFGLGGHDVVDVVVDLPHGKGQLTRRGVRANQRLTISTDSQ